MAMVNFKKGLLGSLPTEITEGTLYVTTDERAMYLDVSATERIRLGDFQEFDTVALLEANPNPSTTALYYVKDINCLAKWDGVQYVQINLDTGMTSVEVVGEGNAVTAAAYDATGRKLTLTKGATYMTAADVDGKIAAVVGEIPADADGAAQTVKDYVDAKTAGIATDAALGELGDRVTTAESDITALEGLVGTENVGTQIDNKIAALDLANTYEAKGAAAAVQGDTAGTVKSVEDALAAYEASNDAAVKAADDKAVAAQADVDALEAAVGTPADGKTIVEMIADAQTAATYDDTQVKADIQANTEAIAAEKARMDAFMALEDGETLNAALDSLKELQDYITSEAADADIVVGKVAALEAILDGIGDTASGEQATVVAYVTEAIAALSIGDYAKAADLTAAVERIAALEGKSHEHANKDLLDTYTQTEADLADAVAKKHEHANAAELDKVVDGKVAAWDAAEGNAKAYTDTALTWGSF